MEHIQQLSLTWVRRPRSAIENVGYPETVEPLPLPARDRIRRLAAIHHSQRLSAKRDRSTVASVSQQQLEALRQFMLELTPSDASTFMDLYTEESSAVEREWLARRRSWKPDGALYPTLVSVLLFAVTVFAIVLAIRYAV